MSQVHWRRVLILASACAVSSACATVDIASATGRGMVETALTTAESKLRVEVAALEAMIEARALAPSELDGVAVAMNVLINGRVDDATASPAAQYRAFSSGDLERRVLIDAQDVTSAVRRVNSNAEQVARDDEVQSAALLGDVLAVERAIALARRAHNTLADVTDDLVVSSPDAHMILSPVLEELDHAVRSLTARADAINARRSERPAVAVG